VESAHRKFSRNPRESGDFEEVCSPKLIKL
jgi:hypothetical protein